MDDLKKTLGRTGIDLKHQKTLKTTNFRTTEIIGLICREKWSWNWHQTDGRQAFNRGTRPRGEAGPTTHVNKSKGNSHEHPRGCRRRRE